MPDEKKLAILDLLARHQVPLIEDDIYGDIFFGKERPRPFMAFDRRGNTISCSSFSKTLAPGYRVGWIATSRHIEQVLERKHAHTLCGPVLLQVALADFLTSGGYDHQLRRVRRIYQHNIAHASRTIEPPFPPHPRDRRPAGSCRGWSCRRRPTPASCS